MATAEVTVSTGLSWIITPLTQTKRRSVATAVGRCYLHTLAAGILRERRPDKAWLEVSLTVFLPGETYLGPGLHAPYLRRVEPYSDKTMHLNYAVRNLILTKRFSTGIVLPVAFTVLSAAGCAPDGSLTATPSSGSASEISTTLYTMPPQPTGTPELLGKWDLTDPETSSGTKGSLYVEPGTDGPLYIRSLHEGGCLEFFGTFRIDSGVLVDVSGPPADSTQVPYNECDSTIVNLRIRELTAVLLAKPTITRSGDILRIQKDDETPYLFTYVPGGGADPGSVAPPK